MTFNVLKDFIWLPSVFLIFCQDFVWFLMFSMDVQEFQSSPIYPAVFNDCYIICQWFFNSFHTLAQKPEGRIMNIGADSSNVSTVAARKALHVFAFLVFHVIGVEGIPKNNLCRGNVVNQLEKPPSTPHPPGHDHPKVSWLAYFVVFAFKAAYFATYVHYSHVCLEMLIFSWFAERLLERKQIQNNACASIDGFLNIFIHVFSEMFILFTTLSLSGGGGGSACGRV